MNKLKRTSQIHRKTKETDIELTLNLDGSGKAEIDTGIGFFDHMLDNFARHGFFPIHQSFSNRPISISNLS